MPITIKLSQEHLDKLSASLSKIDAILDEHLPAIAADPTLLNTPPIKNGRYTPIDTGTLRGTIIPDIHAIILRSKIHQLLNSEDTPCENS